MKNNKTDKNEVLYTLDMTYNRRDFVVDKVIRTLDRLTNVDILKEEVPCARMWRVVIWNKRILANVRSHIVMANICWLVGKEFTQKKWFYKVDIFNF